MSYLDEIHIKNFRSCRDVKLTLDECTPMVGSNNAGKSNILAAIEWFFDPTSLQESDFRDTTSDVSVEVTLARIEDQQLDEIPDKQQGKVKEYIKDGQLRLRRTQKSAGSKKSSIQLEAWRPTAEDCHDGGWTILGPKPLRDELESLFPEPIKIGAMEDAAEDTTKAKASSTIGKLLRDLISTVKDSHGAELDDFLAPLRSKLTLPSTSRAQELKRFDDEATKALQHFFPGINIHLDVPIPSVKELFDKGTIKVSEPGGGSNTFRELTALGHGAQRSIQMALIRYLADVQTKKAQRRLLLIEEPELFLHPHAVRQVRSALNSLSGSGYQVAFATHSPAMINHKLVVNTRIVRKNPTTGETEIMSSAKKDLKDRVQANDKRLYNLFAVELANDWLFSDCVLLVEGAAERYLLPFIYKKVTSRTPDEDGLTILNVGGKQNLPPTLQVLNELRVNALALADLDFVDMKGGCPLLEDSDEDLCAFHDQMNKMFSDNTKSGLDTEGSRSSNKKHPADCKKLGKKSWSASQCEEWAAGADAKPIAAELHRKLRDKKVWLWTLGSIETHLGLQGEKEHNTWASYCMRLETEDLKEVVHDHESVTALVNWLERQGDPT